MSLQTTKEIAVQFSDDELAELVLGLKEQAAELRQNIWAYEDELRNRLVSRNAKRLQGDKWLVKSSVKREIKWDEKLILVAQEAAYAEGIDTLFCRAFPVVFKPSISNLNELMKFGGKTAEAIEAAKTEVKETLLLEIEAAKPTA